MNIKNEDGNTGSNIGQLEAFVTKERKLKRLKLFYRLTVGTLALGLLAVTSALAYNYISGRSGDIKEPFIPKLVKAQDLKAELADNPNQFKGQVNVGLGFADLVESIVPSVVSISAVKIVKTQGASPFANIDPNFREFFKQFIPQMQIPTEQKVTSLGSGFVVRSDGFVVTNYHVIQEAGDIQVIFNDGKEYEASIYASDQVTDIALLKIEAESLTTVKFGASENVRVGDPVIAIGNPFGLGGTVSAGIVSAKARQISIGVYNDFIQTDAAVNRGNSGGPMINIQGEVIGMNTAIFSTTGGSIGIGFAVPSDTLSDIVSQLIVNKKVVRGWLGVQFQEVDASIAENLSLDNTNGILVSNVIPDSPADTAGIKTGDVVVAVNDEAITNPRSLPQLISRFAPGSEIGLTVISQKTEKVIRVVIEEIPSSALNTGEQESSEAETPQDSSVEGKFYEGLGLSVADSNGAIRQRFGLPDTFTGVIIISVASGSLAHEKGLGRGLRIVSVNQEKVDDIATFDKLVNKYESSNGLLILVEDREGNKLFVSFSAEELEEK